MVLLREKADRQVFIFACGECHTVKMLETPAKIMHCHVCKKPVDAIRLYNTGGNLVLKDE